ncbi:MAG: hypothetical protein NWF00_09260 [Candidatus Bathyarchaeota archaeon]|nr:hypothetical protein [Candidatus Bathyarchaeota archaeon]
MQIDEAAPTIVKLGLTFLQAKVYLALVTLGTSTGRTAAKVAKVASQDVYRVLAELQEKGLVEKVIGKPNRYNPTPIQEGICLLLKRKAKEYKENERKAEEILDDFKRKQQENTENNEFQFLMLTTKDANARKIHEGTSRIERGVDVIDSWVSFKYSILIYAEEIAKCVKRKVKVRFITDKPKEGETTPKIFQTWKQKGQV